MKKYKRIFIIVLDSFGIGEMPDAAAFGDEGSNTLSAVVKSEYFDCPNLMKLGLFDIDGVCGGEGKNIAAVARLAEKSAGKDTVTGHWEIAGFISENPFPVYPDGFPTEFIKEFEKAVGRKTLCNKPASGTEVIKEYGGEHIKTGDLIVYTSGDSVLQIAAHEDVVPVSELYRYCEIARGMTNVCRVIARPFAGEYPFVRTPRRHDYALPPQGETMLDIMTENGLDVYAVGKISDIFAHRGINREKSFTTVSNEDGMDKAEMISEIDFSGICFVNLVEFDSVYGHRNNTDGYAKALSDFDLRIGKFIGNIKDDDAVIITADHGCDPSTPSTDHSREYVPMIFYAKGITPANLGTRGTFADICATVLDNFGLPHGKTAGKNLFV